LLNSLNQPPDAVQKVSTRLIHSFDPEAMRVMGVAYELVRAAFGYRGVKIDDDTIADKVIANKIIELAKAGERNPDLLCEETLKCFQQQS
jgi:hypothetical protein